LNLNKLKKLFGIFVSIVIHVLIIFLILHSRYIKDIIKYQPTATKGYTLELTPNKGSTGTNSFIQNATITTHPAGSLDRLPNNVQEINFIHHSSQISHSNLHQAVPSKIYHYNKQKPQLLHNKKIVMKQKVIHFTNNKTYRSLNKIVHHGIQKTFVPIENAIIVTSKPNSTDQIGAGDNFNSSTNGSGNESGEFDFRIIQYGRQTALAITQNIVTPENYRYTPITYRAFIRLNHNMQFEYMQLIKSTGDRQYDNNISHALRQTIYPPLPPNADWNRYHNIDFRIIIKQSL
jgi:hypothetical protein